MTWYARDSEVLNNFSAIGFSLSLYSTTAVGECAVSVSCVAWRVAWRAADYFSSWPRLL